MIQGFKWDHFEPKPVVTHKTEQRQGQSSDDVVAKLRTSFTFVPIHVA